MSFFNKIFKVLMLIATAAFFFPGCGDQPLFDELATNRLKVVIKGTYESNNPRDWQAIPAADVEEVDDLAFSASAPTTFMLDIAELQLDGKEFALYRKTYTIAVTDADPFFNGTGVLYENDDVPDRTYSYVSMYIRKMIFNNARKYHWIDNGDPLDGDGTWYDDGPAEVIFKENTVEGFDFNQLQVNTYYDSLRLESTEINRIFPLSIPIDGNLVYDRDNPETVLEIRLVIKNFVKRYEYDYLSDYRYAYHFFGLSDWLRDVRAGDKYFGGNLHAVARTYVPGKTVTLQGTAATGSYVIAFTEGTIDDYTMTLAELTGRPARPAYDAPIAPNTVVPGDLESYLDYYLKYEKYKLDYNTFITNVDNGNYATLWDTYEAPLKTYKIPPLVTWTGISTTFTLENVPVGKTYYVYQTNDAIGSGELPRDVQFTFIGSATVSENDVGLTLPVPYP